MKILIPFFLVLSSLGHFGCASRPVMELRAAEQSGNQIFEFSKSNLNGLLDIRIWRVEDKSVLWDVNLNYYDGERLAYGEIPKGFTTFNGNKNDAKQRFPLRGAAPDPLPAGAKLRMQVTVQYDTFMTAAATAFFYDIKTDSTGKIVILRPASTIQPADMPEVQYSEN